MIKGEAKALETEPVIYLAKNEAENLENPNAIKTRTDTSSDEQTKKLSLDNRFARLKKSLRKRSVSIL